MEETFTLARSVDIDRGRNQFIVWCNCVKPSLMGSQPMTLLGMFQLSGQGKVQSYNAETRNYFPVSEWFYSGPLEIILFTEDINNLVEDVNNETCVCLHFRKKFF